LAVICNIVLPGWYVKTVLTYSLKIMKNICHESLRHIDESSSSAYTAADNFSPNVSSGAEGPTEVIVAIGTWLAWDQTGSHFLTMHNLYTSIC
jgi:hypothetical protein